MTCMKRTAWALGVVCLMWASCPVWAGDHPRTGGVAASSCVLGCDTGWRAIYAIDGNPGSAWSSQYRTEWLPPESPEWIAFWFDTVRYTDYARLVPRTYNGRNQCVPHSIEIYYVDLDLWVWKLWASVELRAEMFQAGQTIAMPYGVQTNGIFIRTYHLRPDDYGGYYFQKAELYAGSFECAP